MARVGDRGDVEAPSLEQLGSEASPSHSRQEGGDIGGFKPSVSLPSHSAWWQPRSADAAPYHEWLRSTSSGSLSGRLSESTSDPDLAKQCSWRHRLLPARRRVARKGHFFLGSEYVERMTFAAAWMVFLLVGYCLSRLCTMGGLPSDGNKRPVMFNALDDVAKMLQYGFILGWFVGAFAYDRFMWLWSRFWFPLVYLGTIVIYAAASNIPAFKHSLVDVARWGAGMWILVIVAAVVASAVIVWHLWAAWAVRLRRLEVVAYLASRGAIFLFFGTCAALLRHSRYDRFHLHHLYIGWAIALFAEFDHAVSGLALAIGSAIFVQGIGAYSFAPIYSDSACFHTTQSATALRCDFHAASNFTVSVCPGPHMPTPQYVCHNLS